MYLRVCQSTQETLYCPLNTLQNSSIYFSTEVYQIDKKYSTHVKKSLKVFLFFSTVDILTFWSSKYNIKSGVCQDPYIMITWVSKMLAIRLSKVSFQPSRWLTTNSLVCERQFLSRILLDKRKASFIEVKMVDIRRKSRLMFSHIYSGI